MNAEDFDDLTGFRAAAADCDAYAATLQPKNGLDGKPLFAWWNPVNLFGGPLSDHTAIARTMRQMECRHDLEGAQRCWTGVSAGAIAVDQLTRLFPRSYSVAALVAGLSEGSIYRYLDDLALPWGAVANMLPCAANGARCAPQLPPRALVVQGGRDHLVPEEHGRRVAGQYRRRYGLATKARSSDVVAEEVHVRTTTWADNCDPSRTRVALLEIPHGVHGWLGGTAGVKYAMPGPSLTESIADFSFGSQEIQLGDAVIVG